MLSWCLGGFKIHSVQPGYQNECLCYQTVEGRHSPFCSHSGVRVWYSQLGFKCLPLWFAPSVSELTSKVSCNVYFWALILLKISELLIMVVPQSVKVIFPLLHSLEVVGENKQTITN